MGRDPEVAAYIETLKKSPSEYLFNPWFQTDPENDRIKEAPEVRRRQLQAYLSERRGKARILLIAEALGYQGGHFTGIAMTSERILLGHQREKYGVGPDSVFRSVTPERTSRHSVNRLGMSEPTATIVWGALADLGIDPYRVVLWNAVPWHPWRTGNGRLSNRTPNRKEMEAGLGKLREFLTLFPEAQPVAVGRKCQQSLSLLGMDPLHVRHPANGGAPAFRNQLKQWFG
ncbi:MAG: uracil-DNA glycosylase [Balneolaceae bacterium]